MRVAIEFTTNLARRLVGSVKAGQTNHYSIEMSEVFANHRLLARR
jgi:hypothetical protein